MHKLLKFLFIVFFCGQTYALELDNSLYLQNLERSIDNTSLSLQQANSSYDLNQDINALDKQKQGLESCLKREKLALEELSFNKNLLNLEAPAPALQVHKKSYEHQINFHKNNYQYCGFLIKKINIAKIKINRMLYRKHRQELFELKPNIIQTFKDYARFLSIDLKVPKFRVYVYNQSLVLHFFKPLIILIMLFTLVAILSFFNLNWFSLVYFPLSQIVYASLIFIVVSPIFIESLSYDFNHHFILVLDIFKQLGILNIFSILIYYFLLKNLHFQQSFRELLPILLFIGLFICLHFICFIINFLNLELVTPELIGLILVWKYLFLLFFTLLVLVGIFLLKKYVIMALPYKNRFIVITKLLTEQYFPHLNGVFLFMLVLGCFGYVNLMIAILFFIANCFCFFASFLIFFYELNEFIISIRNPQTKIGMKMRQFLFIGQSEKIFELYCLKYIWLFGFIGYFALTIWPLAYLPDPIILKTYGIFFESHNAWLPNSNLVLINILWAIGLFLVLNIFNRFLSTFLAVWFGHKTEKLEKYQGVFYILGIMLIIPFCLNISKIDFKSMSFIIGGLSFGLGIGLRDLIGNFIAGIILLFASRFSKGQYVIVADAHGFIQKISLMDTQMESFDRVILTIPNLQVLTSVVQNFSLSEKTPPRFHFTFILTDIKKIELYKKTILEILATEKEVVMTGHFKPEFFVLPSNNSENNKELQLNLGYSIHHIRVLWQVVSSLTVRFTESLYTSKSSIYLRSSSLTNI